MLQTSRNDKYLLGFTVTVFLISCSLSYTWSANVFGSLAQHEYTYYGYVPAKMWQYNLIDYNDLNSGWTFEEGSASSAGLVIVVGIKDGTYVKVYSLDNGSLVSEAIIDSLEKHYTVFRNGSFFKVVTNQLACVLLLDYGSVPFGNESNMPTPKTFFQSTSGTYAGKEFVLIATAGDFISAQYTIFALEDAEVTVTREDGQKWEYTLKVNSWKTLMLLPPLAAFKIESTGNVMIQSGSLPDGWGEPQTFFVPSVEGGFVGKTFYSWSTTSWDATESYGYRVSTAEDTTVTVWNLETKEKILTANVKANSGLGFKPKAPAIVVQSSKPITLAYLHNGSLVNINGNGIYGAYGSGVSYFGVRSNEETSIYLPVDSFVEAYIFANEESEITVDSEVYTIDADTYHLLTQPGTHLIHSNKNVVVEVLNWPSTPEYQGLMFDGVQIPSIQTVDTVSNVKVTPLEGEFPIVYVLIGAAAMATIIMAFLFVRSNGKNRPVFARLI
ncbi:hypothetical protein KEJ18_06835 [Candidatus Bathyarchaeota archaeon]|nr:hypothetical protein [Candidatus Bathyarchaeota archaeon]